MELGGNARHQGYHLSPLRPANSGFTVAWSDIFRDRFEGQPLKGVALTFGAHSVRGEAIIIRTGIEGGAIYALSAELRDAISRRACDPAHRAAARSCDGLDRAAVGAEGQTIPSNFLRKAASFSPVAIGFLQEATKTTGISLTTLPPAVVARLINAVPIELAGSADRPRDLDRGRIVRRTRSRFHAPPFARRFRGGRDAGLGSADRRLSAAGVVRDGGRGWKGRVEVAGSPMNAVALRGLRCATAPPAMSLRSRGGDGYERASS